MQFIKSYRRKLTSLCSFRCKASPFSVSRYWKFLAYALLHTPRYTPFRRTLSSNSRYKRCCDLQDDGCAWTYTPASSPGTYKPPCPPVSWSLDKSSRPPGPTCRPEKYTAERESAWFEDSFSASAKPSAPPLCRTPGPRLPQNRDTRNKSMTQWLLPALPWFPVSDLPATACVR